MSSWQEFNEMDDRLPTGEWTGFFVQPDGRQRFVMDLFLRFQDGIITGEGDDFIGEFTIKGKYESSTPECAWSKHYVGQHVVEYAGRAIERGIIGQWTITDSPSYWCGPFMVWPRSWGDQSSLFERAFVEYMLDAEVELAEPALLTEWRSTRVNV